MSADAAVIIIGSGPAGVAAAFPLLAQGCRVLMLEGGEDAAEGDAPSYPHLQDVRHRSDQWKLIVGERYEAFEDADAPSPKFRVPAHRHVLRQFQERVAIRPTNFTAIGALAAGGLANIWGTGVSRFDDEDLADYPISLRDIAPSYGRISERIGINGSNADDMAPVLGHDPHLLAPTRRSGQMQRLLARYQSRPGPARRHGVRLGAARNAVLTEQRGARGGCVHCGLCLWGCQYGAIWSAKHDLQALKRHPNFRYRAATLATGLARTPAGWRVLAEDAGSGTALGFEAARVFLACGALGSAKLALAALALHERDIAFQTSPTAGFAVLVSGRKPARGRRLEDNTFGLAQATFKVEEPRLRRGYAFGHLFAGDTIQAAEYVRQMGSLSYPAARRVVRVLQPRLLVGNCFLDGAYTRHTLRLARSGELRINGGYAPEAAAHAGRVRKRLAAALRRYGAWLLPGSFRLAPPGADAHYGATVPMRAAPRPHEANHAGEVHGLPGVYVVDGSALTRVPPKPHTLSIMANADRIAASVAAACAGS